MTSYNFNNSQNTTKNISNNKSFFCETLKTIENKWTQWDNEIKEYIRDFEQLDNMFNKYGRDNRFLELKKNIEEKKLLNKQKINYLEELVFKIKKELSINIK